MRPWLAAWSVAAIRGGDHRRACGRGRPRFASMRTGLRSRCITRATGLGFDVLLAQAIADRICGPRKSSGSRASWTRISSPQLEANALLSAGAARWSAAMALTKDSLVKPGMKTARLPDFAGATRDDRRRRVALGVLVPSQPYVYSPMTVVLGPKAQGRKIGDIGDLGGLRLAIESGSLGDAILMTFEKGRLIAHHPSRPRPRRSPRRAPARRL